MDSFEKARQMLKEGEELIKQGMDRSDPVFIEWVSKIRELIDSEFCN